jgi:hypothetical protein
LEISLDSKESATGSGVEQLEFIDGMTFIPEDDGGVMRSQAICGSHHQFIRRLFFIAVCVAGLRATGHSPLRIVSAPVARQP